MSVSFCIFELLLFLRYWATGKALDLLTRTGAERGGAWSLTAARRKQVGKVRTQSVQSGDEDLLWQMRARSVCRSATSRTSLWRCSTRDDTVGLSRPCMLFGRYSLRCSPPSTAIWNLQSLSSAAKALKREKKAVSVAESLTTKILTFKNAATFFPHMDY